MSKTLTTTVLAALVTIGGYASLTTTVLLEPAKAGISFMPRPRNTDTDILINCQACSYTDVPSISALGINLSGVYYQAAGNQLIDWNNRFRGPHFFECTEFAYGRAIEKGVLRNNQGIATVLLGDAHTWDDRVANSIYKNQLSTTPRKNSILVWEANQQFNWSEGNWTYSSFTDPVAGHVAFVEKVYGDGSFIISEGNHTATPVVRLIKAGTPPAQAAKFIHL